MTTRYAGTASDLLAEPIERQREVLVSLGRLGENAAPFASLLVDVIERSASPLVRSIALDALPWVFCDPVDRGTPEARALATRLLRVLEDKEAPRAPTLRLLRVIGCLGRASAHLVPALWAKHDAPFVHASHHRRDRGWRSWVRAESRSAIHSICHDLEQHGGSKERLQAIALLRMHRRGRAYADRLAQNDAGG